MRIRVPLGPRRVVGILVAIGDHSEVEHEKMRAAEEILDETPLLPHTLVNLIGWAARYYHHPVGEAWQAALPQLLRVGRAPDSAGTLLWRLSRDGLGLPSRALPRAPKQAKLIDLLRHQGQLDRESIAAADISTAVMRQLEQKGLIEKFTGNPHHAVPSPAIDSPKLNEGQQAALLSITSVMPGYQCHLLEGITGSGKTEVYLRLIEQTLNVGGQVLVLIPEIGLTPQTLDRFRHRFGAAVVTYNSEMSDRERLSAWNSMRTGSASVVIGTRSGVWLPMAKPGLIIVDEEHDISYKQQDGFRYHARDIAIKRAQLESVPVVLGSATPSLETLSNAVSGRFHHHALPVRAGGAALPDVRTMDVRKAELESGLSGDLLEQINIELSQNRQVLLFINRRGYAPSLLCHDCGWIASCHACDARLTVHARDRHLRCHQCEFSTPLPGHCSQCGSRQLLAMGVGTQRTEETLRKLVPNVPVLRVDRDSTARRGSMENILRTVNAGEPCILIGTQMLAKGHHFANVSLVGVLDADHGLFSADLRGSERMAQLLVQVSGRAGRTNIPGQVIIQTHYPEHPMLQSLLQQGYPEFARSLLAERQLVEMPPYSHMAIIRAESPSSRTAEETLRNCRSQCETNLSMVNMLGPLPSTLSRRAGHFRFFLMLRSTDRAPLHQAVDAVIAILTAKGATRNCRWSVDIDPMESG